MRWVPLALVAMLTLPTVLAADTYSGSYVMSPIDNGFGGGGALARNGVRFFPSYGTTDLAVTVTDVSGLPVKMRVCHEWTYDDGSHPTVRCTDTCSPTFAEPLTWPPWLDNTTYRVILDLRSGAAGCAAAKAGQYRVTFT